MNPHPDIAAVLEGRSQWCVVAGDCLAVLPTLPAGCVDAAVTDPPYGHNNNNGDLIHRREEALGVGKAGEARPIANDGAEAKYAAIARRRIADAAPLFVPPPAPAPAGLFAEGQ